MAMSDSETPGRTPGGLLDSLRTLIATLVGMAHTRVALFGNELEEELHRVVELIVGAMVILALGGFALLFTALVVVAAYWDTHRVIAVAAVAAVFTMLTIVAFVTVRARTQRRARLLAATIGELERDLRQLGNRSST
jgi:uncharacterized membrane protein YqjE